MKDEHTGQNIVSPLDIEIPKPTVINCIIRSRGEILFYGVEGAIIPNLDGYAVIPREEYERLISLDGQGAIGPHP